ncbi:hypothetical protein Pelo_12139 [Pelomyxa schiedti]|nr:hypothetical protein Pelo_12139 [Pelomyxa schiedti]
MKAVGVKEMSVDAGGQQIPVMVFEVTPPPTNLQSLIVFAHGWASKYFAGRYSQDQVHLCGHSLGAGVSLLSASRLFSGEGGTLLGGDLSDVPPIASIMAFAPCKTIPGCLSILRNIECTVVVVEATKDNVVSSSPSCIWKNLARHRGSTSSPSSTAPSSPTVTSAASSSSVHLVPTRYYIKIEGGNHTQFCDFWGSAVEWLDGKPTISGEHQRTIATQIVSSVIHGQWPILISQAQNTSS